MTSAWANPILYGFLNENFKKEFSEMFKNFKTIFAGKGANEENTTVQL